MNGLALCAGAGGLELGLHLAQPTYRTVCYVEREAYAASILAARMADGSLAQAPIWDDLVTFSGRPWRGIVQILTAGFPCQPWSCAGKRQGTADARWLWPHIAGIIRQVAPPLVFVENVFPGFLHGGLSEILGTLAQSGYAAEWDVFSAAASGAPHLRKRVFVLGAHAASVRRQALGSGHVSRLGTQVADAESAVGRTPRACQAKARPARLPLDGREPLADAALRRHALRGDGSQANDGEERGAHPWWAVEPDVGRVADGVASRVDRLRACGNGVVPQVAARAFTTLAARLFAPAHTPFKAPSNAPQNRQKRSLQTHA